mmetsp:Transcript_59990/g.178558  ORF Transcript_59990/g.178558 Transcript_59990/m.178558 type:complete len:205 (-) Transcript_59990:993-1607(-)
MSRTCFSFQLAGKPRTRMHHGERAASPLPGLPSSLCFSLFALPSAALGFSSSASRLRFLPLSLCFSLPFSFCLSFCFAAATDPSTDRDSAAPLLPSCPAASRRNPASAAASSVRRACETSPVSSRNQAKRSGPLWNPSRPSAGLPSQPSPMIVSEGQRVLLRSSPSRSTRTPSASKPKAPLAPAFTRSERDHLACTSPPSSSAE